MMGFHKLVKTSVPDRSSPQRSGTEGSWLADKVLRAREAVALYEEVRVLLEVAKRACPCIAAEEVAVRTVAALLSLALGSTACLEVCELGCGYAFGLSGSSFSVAYVRRCPPGGGYVYRSQQR